MTDPSLLISEDEPKKVDELVGEYVAKRDELTEKRREFKQFELETKQEMEKIEALLLEKSRELGVDSFKTQFGTAFKTDKDYARVAGPDGWEKLCQVMVERNDFGLVEKRVAKLHFKEIMAEELEKIKNDEDGLTPSDMGVEYVVEEAIQVRRS